MILRYNAQIDKYVALDSDNDELVIFNVRAPVFLCSDNKYRCILNYFGNIR